jgi:hypothetical protein
VSVLAVVYSLVRTSIKREIKFDACTLSPPSSN